MKKAMVMLLIGAMTLGLTACGGSSDAQSADSTAEATEAAAEGDAAAAEDTAEGDAAAEEGAAEETTGKDASDIKIAGIVFQDDQFMNMLTQGYVDAAEDLGVEIMTDNTNNDAAKEVELINTYLAQGVDGLAIAPLNADASVAALREADKQGMKVALTNIDLTDAEFIVSGYTSNDYDNCKKAGVEAGEILKEKVGDETANIAIIQLASQLPDVSKSRVDGYLAGLDEAGLNYEIVADQDAWLQDTALQAASSIITANSDLDAIIAVNDGGTIGSVTAVQNAGLSDQIMVFGHDGSDQITSMILDENSPLQSVIAQDPYGMGYQAVTDLVHAIQGEDYSETKGKCNYMEGILLSVRDKDAVNSWRVDNGLEEIK